VNKREKLPRGRRKLKDSAAMFFVCSRDFHVELKKKKEKKNWKAMRPLTEEELKTFFEKLAI